MGVNEHECTFTNEFTKDQDLQNCQNIAKYNATQNTRVKHKLLHYSFESENNSENSFLFTKVLFFDK